MAVDWSYFDKFEVISGKYLPLQGEGETMATQIVTATTKLVYKWYNDGDVYDNVNSPMQGWLNDLSSYANWLAQYAGVLNTLAAIGDCYSESDYEDLLKELTDILLDDEYLEAMNKRPKQGSIYKCDGPFEWEDPDDPYDEDDDWY